MLKGNLALPMIIFGFLVYAKKVGVLSDLWGVFNLEAPSWSK